MTTVPSSPRMEIEPSRSFGRAAVVASMTPSAPFREAQHDHGGVFGLDVDERRRRHRVHGVDVAHHPLQQVHMMAGLVGQDAAVERPRTAPVVLVVVRLRPAPPNPDRAHHELPEPSGLERRTELLNRHVEPVLLHDEEPNPCLVAGSDHAVSVGQRQRHRLLHHQVGAIRGELHRMLGVAPALGQDHRDVGRDRAHHLVHVREPRHAVGVAVVHRSLRLDIAHSGQAGPADHAPAEQFGVPLGDPPATHQHEGTTRRLPRTHLCIAHHG